MDMPVRLLEAHPLAEEIRNQVVVKRGPLGILSGKYGYCERREDRQYTDSLRYTTDSQEDYD